MKHKITFPSARHSVWPRDIRGPRAYTATGMAKLATSLNGNSIAKATAAVTITMEDAIAGVGTFRAKPARGPINPAVTRQHKESTVRDISKAADTHEAKEECERTG